MIESARYLHDGTIAAVIDGVPMSVPDDPANGYRRMISAWEGEGNTIAPASISVASYGAAVQAHIDATAQERNYDSALSCVSYETSANPVWAAEAAALRAWRDVVWTYAYAQLALVETQQREAPTIEAFIGDLPPMSWPV